MEFVRKAIHMVNVVFPLAYHMGYSRDFLLKILFIVAFVALSVEYSRLRFAPVQTWFIRTFGPALRPREATQVTGATYGTAGIIFTIVLFPREIAIPALMVLAFSDALAAVVGIPLGKHRFLSKSLEGSLAFLSATLVIFAIWPVAGWVALVIIAVLATLLEAWPKSFDDNMLIPLAVGTLLYLAQYTGL